MPKQKVNFKELEEVKVNPLKDELADKDAEIQRLREALETKEVAEKKEKDPMSGPGKLCECTKVTKSEAWQLPSREVFNPKTQGVEMKTAPVPEGYYSIPGTNNDHYVLSEPAKSLSEAKLLPNCRSKYTKEYSVFGPKSMGDRGQLKVDPPRYNVFLCEKHAELFGGKDPVKK